MSSRSISLLGLGILSGAMIGTALGQFLGYIPVSYTHLTLPTKA